MESLESTFGSEKPIIGMAHFPPIPGSPLHKKDTTVKDIKNQVLSDTKALQQGGIDAVMFCNEGDRPYIMDLDPTTLATMARIIGEVQAELGSEMPIFGTDILWSPKGAISLGKATGASFVREVFTGAYESESGIWNTQCGKVHRYRDQIDAQDIPLLYNINAEFAGRLSDRSLTDAAKSAVFSSLADVLCVSGPMTGSPTSLEDLRKVKDAVPDTPVFANTGVDQENVADVLSVADGAVVGTSLKENANTWNQVEKKRVQQFMEIVRQVR